LLIIVTEPQQSHLPSLFFFPAAVARSPRTLDVPHDNPFPSIRRTKVIFPLFFSDLSLPAGEVFFRCSPFPSHFLSPQSEWWRGTALDVSPPIFFAFSPFFLGRRDTNVFFSASLSESERDFFSLDPAASCVLNAVLIASPPRCPSREPSVRGL